MLSVAVQQTLSCAPTRDEFDSLVLAVRRLAATVVWSNGTVVKATPQERNSGHTVQQVVLQERATKQETVDVTIPKLKKSGWFRRSASRSDTRPPTRRGRRVTRRQGGPDRSPAVHLGGMD